MYIIPIYFFAGALIVELIICFNVIIVSPEEKEKAKEISQKAIRSVKVPCIPFLTTAAYESAAATGAYSIMPVKTIGYFMIVWYIIIPVIWLTYKLLTAPLEFQELWSLGMKAMAGY